MTRILIVEDSRMSRMLIRAIVESVYPDAEIVEAVTAEDALENLAPHSIDIATVDLNLPGSMSGMGFAQILRQRCPAARIGILTASSEAHVRAEVEKLGVYFIPKPIDLENLGAFLRGKNQP